MPTVRRLYLYGVSSIGLALLLVGAAELLGLAFDQLDPDPAILAADAESAGERLSRSLALALVGLPLWLAHTWFILRLVAGATPAAATERASTIRAVTMTAVLLATGVAALWAATEVLESSLMDAIVGSRVRDDQDASDALAVLLVAGAAWAVHARWRAADLRTVPDRLAGDWSTRLLLYGPLFILALLALRGAADGIAALLQALAGRAEARTETGWRWQLAEAIGVTVVTSAAWLGHWQAARGLLRAPDPMGAAHRASRTRTACLVGVAVASATVGVLAVRGGLEEALAWVLAAPGSRDAFARLQDVVGPVIAVTPFLLACWWHARRSSGEALAFGGPGRQASVDRAGLAAVALVGLALLAGGLVGLLEAMLEGDLGRALGGATGAWTAKQAVASQLASAITGLVVWAVPWWRLQRRRASDPVGEALATGRRAYLLLVCGTSLLAAGGALAWIAYQLLRQVLEVEVEASSVTFATAVLVVGAGVLVCHAILLAADLRLTSAAALPARQPSALEPAGTLARDAATEQLEISGPPDADFEALNAGLAAHLPRGYRMRVIGHG
jgi:hypothetical protein